MSKRYTPVPAYISLARLLLLNTRATNLTGHFGMLHTWWVFRSRHEKLSLRANAERMRCRLLA